MDREEVLKLFHAIWVDWMKELLRDCKINSDGSRTIPAVKVQKYIEDIMMPANLLDYELTQKNKDQIDKLIEALRTYVKEELDE